jgi:hypothetical protein
MKREGIKGRTGGIASGKKDEVSIAVLSSKSSSNREEATKI